MKHLARATPLWHKLIGALCSSPHSARSLALLRIGTGVALLLKLWLEWDSIITLYGKLGLIQWEVASATIPNSLPDLQLLASLFSRLGLDADASVYCVFGIYALSLVGLILGFLTRFFAGIAWLCLVSSSATAMGSAYGVDSFGIIALFYCVVMPVSGCWAVTPQRIGRVDWVTGLSIKVVQIHLCVVYAASGFSKTQGSQWWKGEAMWRVLRMPQFHRYDLSWLSAVPWVFVCMCWFTLVIEGGYPFMIWHKRIGRLWLAGIIGLHIGIALLLGLWVFSAMMIVLNLSGFYFYHFGRSGEKSSSPAFIAAPDSPATSPAPEHA